MKHIAFHVLVGVYFMWLVVFGALITMAIINEFGQQNYELSRAFIVWIFFNLVMGTVLFIVIRLFRNSGLLNKLILYTYYFMAAATVTTVLIIRR